MFPTQVNVVPAVGVAGDFASSNPRNSVVNGPGAFVAGAAGVTVGLFAWADAATNRLVLNTGTGVPTGFVHRSQQALITTYLAEGSNVIPSGMPVTLFSAGEFWVVNNGAAATVVGMSAYANLTTGVVSFLTTGTLAVAGTIATKWYALSVGAIGELVKMSSHALG